MVYESKYLPPPLITKVQVFTHFHKKGLLDGPLSEAEGGEVSR